jgi:GNAT superfamily N-acetyltransferase
MNRLLRRALVGIAGSYDIYRVFATSAIRPIATPLPALDHIELVNSDAIDASPDPLVREQRWYAGDGAFSFAYLEQGRIAGACFYWHGARYQERNFWPLSEREAKLVQVVTTAEMRGRGVARRLIESSANDMLSRGFTRLYARIWHSNAPSLAAFSAAGWLPVSTVVQMNPLRLARPWRVTVGERPRGRA